MKNNFIIFILFFIPLFSMGQEKSDKIIPKRNTIYLDVFGQGIVNSLSFDRLYRINKKVKTFVGAGITLLPLLRKENLLILGIPLSYNWLFGKRKSHLELGVGLTLLTETQKGFYAIHDCKTCDDFAYIGIQTFGTNGYLYFTPKVGYRFQNPKGGLFFRISLTPPIPLIDRKCRVKYKGETFRVGSNTYFPEAGGLLDRKIFPWFGISLGYTLK